jgi:hypothetical protein
MLDLSHASPGTKVRVSRAMMGLFDDWRIDGADRVRLLGLPAGTRPRQLRRYREGTPLPDDPRVWERVEHLLGIADALRTTFPLNEQMGTLWIRQRNRRLGQRSPLDTMLERGLEGVVEVRSQLDCAYDWHLDDLRSGKA